jgi:aryl-alcohol dehydrogenase-like predicted oxidoreductase
MNFGKRTAAAESERIVHRALERGVVVFDTANVYVEGESERIIGRALRGHRDEVVVASKVGLDRVNGRAEGLSRAAIAKALDGSLSRLGTDFIDVYYLHAPDHATPIEETLDALKVELDRGRVRDWGVSNYASWQILEMFALADARGMRRPVASQVLYNLLIRQIEVEHLAFGKRYDVHVTVYNALAGGLLTGRYAAGTTLESAQVKGTRFDGNAMYQRRYWSERMFDLGRALEGIARDEGMSIIDLAYAWLATQARVDSILVGPASVVQLDAAIDACAKRVSAEACARIDTAFRAWTGTDTSYVR